MRRDLGRENIRLVPKAIRSGTPSRIARSSKIRLRPSACATVCGASSPTNEITVTVAGPAAPGPPTDLQASVAGGIVTLTWTPPSGGAPLTTYIIEVGSSPSTPANLLVQAVGPSPSLTAAASPGAYHVRVRAQNAAGVGPPSVSILVSVP